MGFFGSLFGQDGAGAAREASADTYLKQQNAVNKLLGYGNEYAQSYQNLGQSYAPYVQTGYNTNSALQNLINDPSSLRSQPGYQFQQEEGGNALDRSAAARGMLQSGRGMKDQMRFSQGLADSTYGSTLDRLMRGSQLGLGATQAQVGTVGQGLTGQLGARTTAYGGDMASAGTIGQGIIGAQNAENAGVGNIINLGLKGIGFLAGGGFGGK